MRKLCCLLAMVLLAANFSGCAGRYTKYRAEFSGLFDTMTVVVGYTKTKAEFDRYADVIHTRMEALDRLYDIYHEYPGMNNVRTVNQNAGVAPVPVERDLIDLLTFAQNGYETTNGTVNVMMGAVLRIWHDYRLAGEADEETAELPPMARLIEAAAHTDISALVIDLANQTAYITDPLASLDVGAVAKGYAAGLAAEAARAAGMANGLVDAGGNVVAFGKPMDGARARWGVGIQDPDLTVSGLQNMMDTVYVNDAVVACSGGYQRYYVVDGVVYNHVIDKDTLMPATRYKNVSVVTQSAGMSDLMSTALFILPYEDGKRLAAKTGTEALWVFADGQIEATDGYIGISKNMGGYSGTD